jgi:hypothetical protein
MLDSRFADDYKRLVGVDTVKKCKTLDEFLDKATAVNRELANKREVERITRKELRPSYTFKAITELVEGFPTSVEEAPSRELEVNSDGATEI